MNTYRHEPSLKVLAGMGAAIFLLAFAVNPLLGVASDVDRAQLGKHGQATLPPTTGFAPENHDGVPGVWLDGPDGFEIAKRIHLNNGTPLLIYVYTDWCGYCRRLNTQILPDAGVQACLNQMTKVKINAETSEQAKRLASELRIAGYPTLLVRQKDDFMLRPFPTIVPPQQFTAACQAEIKKAGG